MKAQRAKSQGEPEDLREHREVGQPGGLNTRPQSLSLCRQQIAFERFGLEE